MPFVTNEHRENPDLNIPGDRCFVFYREMMEKWKANPRWTTADEIYAGVVDLNQSNVDLQRAKELAWQVFFNLHVMKFELEKQKLNGDIK